MGETNDVLADAYPGITYRFCLTVIRGITGNRRIGSQGEIDDIAQETAIRFVVYAREHVLKSPKAVLRQIARNVVSEFLRKKKRTEDRIEDDTAAILEAPFIVHDDVEFSPTKEEFLRRAFAALTSDDRKLFDVVYAHEKRSLAEQAEILNKSTRAHTVQKNRFLARLRKVKMGMVSDVSAVIQWPRIPNGPNLFAQEALLELGVTDDEKGDYRLLIARANSFYFFEAQFFAQKNGHQALGGDLDDVTHRYHVESMCQMNLLPALAERITDHSFQAYFCNAVSRHMAAHGLHDEEIFNMFIASELRAIKLFQTYGLEKPADEEVKQCHQFLHMFRRESEIESLPSKLEGVDLSTPLPQVLCHC